MEATIAALKAGHPLPPPGNGQRAEIIGDAWGGTWEENWSEGFKTVDPESHGPEMRYLVQTTDHGRVLLGENIERQDELRDILTGGMQLSLLATLMTTCIAGFWMARRAQARLNTINDGLAQVAQGQLDCPIKLDGRDDLSLLAERINATTKRLDHAFSLMRVQSSNIAHDLRTPLARLRAQIEVNLIALTQQNRQITPDDLSAALEQIDQITATFEALLRLARIESGAGREAFGPVVEDAGQTLCIEMTNPATVHGDHDMLVQLLANLIQNALQHGAQEQTILLHVHGTYLSIRDQGPSIPLKEREKVLQPLYQGERTRQGKGSGLGLALVRAIADLHKADLALSDGPKGQGLTVSLQFPSPTII